MPRSIEADTLGRDVIPTPKPPVVSPLPSPPPPATAKIPQGADKEHFTLHEIEVDGNTVYKHLELNEIYHSLIGTEITVADLYTVTQRMTQRYRDDGYILASVYLPPQTIKQGRIKIRISEGYVAHIRWTGDEIDNGVVASLANELTRSNPFNGKTLESVMLRLNDLPSVNAQATIAPYQAEDVQEGAVEIAIAVTRKRISVSAGVNDNASRYMGTWQDSLQVQFSGLLTGVDQLSFTGANSLDPGRFHYERGEYSVPLNMWGTVARMGVSNSHSAPSYTLKDLEIRSQANSGWIGLNQGLIRSRARNLSLSMQFTVTNQTTDVLGEPFYDDRVRDLNVSTSYNFSDSWSGYNAFSFAVDQGFNILGATKTGSSMLSRAEGHSDFTKFNLNASRLQDLAPGYSLLASFAGQFSTVPLLSLGQFGYGGTEFGRAFDSSEISGDDGVEFSVELRHDPISIFKDFSVAPFAFFDGGCVWNLDSEGASSNAASTGLGVRMAGWNYMHTDVTVALPFTSTPSTPKLGFKEQDPRFLISLRFGY